MGRYESARRFLAFYVLIAAGYMTLLVAHTFLLAHMNDGRIVVAVDEFGEASVEYWAFLLLVALLPWAFYVMDEALRAE